VTNPRGGPGRDAPTLPVTGVGACYTSATSTSSSPPSVAEKRTFGVLSVRTVQGGTYRLTCLGLRKRAFYDVGVISRLYIEMRRAWLCGML